jgi:uncharacterized protein YuzE
MRNPKAIGFEVSISGRDDGTIEAAYIQISTDPVHRTKEIRKDIILVDYSDEGELVGIEILAPVRMSELVKLVKKKQPKHGLKKFIASSVPRELVLA